MVSINEIVVGLKEHLINVEDLLTENILVKILNNYFKNRYLIKHVFNSIFLYSANSL
jgi:hypothetical protein